MGLRQRACRDVFSAYVTGIDIILDVAHNPAASALLAQQLAARPCAGLTCAVTSILADKDIRGVLQPLLPQVAHWFVAGLDLPRGTSGENLANCLQNLGVAAYDIHTAESVTAAFQMALQKCAATDRIVVLGSFYTVAAVYSAGELYANSASLR